MQRGAAKPHRIELQFLEALRRRCPDHPPVLEALGHIYTRIGRYEDGLQIDLKLATLRPAEPEVWYNLSCSYSLTGRLDEALNALHRAVALGYRDAEWMMRDKDLKRLREDPRFKALVRSLKHSRNS